MKKRTKRYVKREEREGNIQKQKGTKRSVRLNTAEICKRGGKDRFIEGKKAKYENRKTR